MLSSSNLLSDTPSISTKNPSITIFPSRSLALLSPMLASSALTLNPSISSRICLGISVIGCLVPVTKYSGNTALTSSQVIGMPLSCWVNSFKYLSILPSATPTPVLVLNIKSFASFIGFIFSLQMLYRFWSVAYSSTRPPSSKTSLTGASHLFLPSGAALTTATCVA